MHFAKFGERAVDSGVGWRYDSIVESKRKPKRPTLGPNTARARKAAKLIIDEGLTQSEAMRRAGYSERAVETRHRPDVEAIRREFQILLDRMIPREYLAQRLLEGLDAKRAVVVPGSRGKDAYIVWERDWHAIAKIAQLVSNLGGLIVRTTEAKVSHTVDLARAIEEGRRRLLEASAPTGSVPERNGTGGDASVTACEVVGDSARGGGGLPDAASGGAAGARVDAACDAGAAVNALRGVCLKNEQSPASESQSIPKQDFEQDELL